MQAAPATAASLLVARPNSGASRSRISVDVKTVALMGDTQSDDRRKALRTVESPLGWILLAARSSITGSSLADQAATW